MVRIISFLNSPPSMGHGSLLGYIQAKESLKASKQREKGPRGSSTLETMTSVEMELGAVSLDNRAKIFTEEEVHCNPRPFHSLEEDQLLERPVLSCVQR